MRVFVEHREIVGGDEDEYFSKSEILFSGLCSFITPAFRTNIQFTGIFQSLMPSCLKPSDA